MKEIVLYYTQHFTLHDFHENTQLIQAMQKNNDSITIKAQHRYSNRNIYNWL